MIDDMQVYIANLGKYNEGELVGDWFSFPLDEEVIAERIGLNAEYEEYAIHDTDNFPMEISEYTSIEELNRIYEQLEELPDYLLDDLDSFVSYYGSLEELVEHKDETLSNKLVRAGRAMNAGVYFVTQSSGDVSKESLKNNIGLKFAFRSTDTNEIKQTLEFFGLDSEDENNQKRLRDLENGQCLMQDLYGRVGVVQIHPVFVELLHAFDTRPPIKSEVDLE